jgi:hypothetical protein
VGQLESYFDVAAGIEAGSCARRGGRLVVFGVQFVVDVGIQAAEAIVARCIGDIGPYSICLDVDQVNDGGGNAIFAVIDHVSLDGAQIHFRLGTKRLAVDS